MDIYNGVAGLHAAWERFKYWLGVELPDQWEQIAALLRALGAPVPAGETGGGYVGGDEGYIPPLPSPTPTTPPTDPLAGYRLADLTPSEQEIAQRFIAAWPELYYHFHAPEAIGNWTDWGGQPQASIAAVIELDWMIVHTIGGVVYAAPKDHPWPAEWAVIEWKPGMPGGRAR